MQMSEMNTQTKAQFMLVVMVDICNKLNTQGLTREQYEAGFLDQTNKRLGRAYPLSLLEESVKAMENMN